VVVVAHGVELGDERRVPEPAERRRREERALEAVRLPRLEDAPGRARRLAVLFLVVAEPVQKALDRGRRSQPAREAKSRVLQDAGILGGKREREDDEKIFLE
jgi:hypothetical protein